MEKINCKDCGLGMIKESSKVRCNRCLKLIKDYKEFIDLVIKTRKEKK